MSNNFDPYVSPPGGPTPRKQGMSTPVKVLLIVSGIGAVLVALCCGGIIFFGARTISMSPEKVNALQKEIVSINIPAPWKPFMAMDLSQMGGPIRMCMYVIKNENDANDTSNMLMLMDIKQDATILDRPQAFQEEMRRQMDVQAEKQRKNMEPLRVVSGQNQTFPVNGRQANVTINDAVGVDSGTKYYELIALFMGKKYPAFLYMRAKQSEMTREQIDAMLDSMKN